MENRQSENARMDAHYITVIACDRTRINRLPGEVRARKVRHIGKTRMSDRFSFFFLIFQKKEFRLDVAKKEELGSSVSEKALRG